MAHNRIIEWEQHGVRPREGVNKLTRDKAQKGETRSSTRGEGKECKRGRTRRESKTMERFRHACERVTLTGTHKKQKMSLRYCRVDWRDHGDKCVVGGEGERMIYMEEMEKQGATCLI